MNIRKIFGYGLCAVIFALAFTACEQPDSAHKHQWGAWNVTTPATCMAEGSQTRTCALDATHIETQTIAIDPDAHDWGEWTENSDGTDTRICALNPEHTDKRISTRISFTGTVTITPSSDVTTGMMMTASYTGDETDITLAYQWYFNEQPIHNEINNTHTPARAGSYTVTVKAAGYNSKMSDPVVVTGEDLGEMEGEITFTANSVTVTSVTVNTQVTAVYSGDETPLTYQWYRNGTAITTNGTSATYTPTQGGTYDVRIGAPGLEPKTSDKLTIDLSGTVAITPHASGLITGVAHTAGYTGGAESVSYQWNHNNTAITPNGTGNTYTPLEGGSYTVTASAEGFNSKTSAAVTVTAIIITFNANGGSWSGNTTTQTAINAVVSSSNPTAPARARTTFDGWYSEANGGTKQTFSAVITTDTTFYARWHYITPLIAIDEVSKYLAGTDGIIPPATATAASPAPLPVNIALGATSAANSGWENLLTAINAANKYVALDLSASTMTGTEFNNPNAATGKDKIVTLKLPNAATSIAARTGTDPNWFYTFQDYTNLKEVGGAVSIGNFAFANMTSLTNISFPEATSIGNQVFQGCTNLTSVSLPKVTSLGLGTFRDCTSLANVSFPEVTTTDAAVFYGCTSLSSVNFPKVTTLGANPFSGCTNLESVSFGALLSIPDHLFNSNMGGGTQYLKLKTVNFPAATSIGNSAFEGSTSLATVNIPLAATIGSQAFYGCTSLTTVNIPGAISIGTNAFVGTSLASVSFPAVTSISEHAFLNCPLVSITIAANVTLDNPDLPNEFITLYNGTANKAAGTYTRPNASSTTWTKQP